ncbi:hypothetical protein [Nocardia wallacei]|uniref:hypothetical protein n=1 Tax=Nocardia wallacei TaxID=480035 RepID=UPI002453ECB9|nr:hypothetical protein [Nocardia wallacei]
MRRDISGLNAPRHALDIEKHAGTLGYQLLYIVRPPTDCDDPVGYALGIAAGLDVEILIVHGLDTLDNSPARVCEDGLDVEVVYPPETWTRARVAAEVDR